MEPKTRQYTILEHVEDHHARIGRYRVRFIVPVFFMGMTMLIAVAMASPAQQPNAGDVHRQGQAG